MEASEEEEEDDDDDEEGDRGFVVESAASNSILVCLERCFPLGFLIIF